MDRMIFSYREFTRSLTAKGGGADVQLVVSYMLSFPAVQSVESFIYNDKQMEIQK